MRIRLGVDVACRAVHQASCADEHGEMLFVGHRFRTDPDELEVLWARLPENVDEVTVVMEPTRNAWVALAAWFRRRGATVVMVPPEQSADLRAYYNKHAKTDLLTELANRSFGGCVPGDSLLARFAARDQWRGRAAGSVPAGGAATRVA